MKIIKAKKPENNRNLSHIITCNKLLQVLQFLTEASREICLQSYMLPKPLPCSSIVRITKWYIQLISIPKIIEIKHFKHFKYSLMSSKFQMD